MIKRNKDSKYECSVSSGNFFREIKVAPCGKSRKRNLYLGPSWENMYFYSGISVIVGKFTVQCKKGYEIIKVS